MKFKQIVEKVLKDLYVPYNTLFDVQPDPHWLKIFLWYEKRYWNGTGV